MGTMLLMLCGKQRNCSKEEKEMKIAVKPNHPLEVLSQDTVDRIHEASFKVLNETGIKIEHKKVLQKLGEAGAEIDKNKQIAKIPFDLIEKSLKKAPKKFTLWARNLEYRAELNGKYSYNCTTSGALQIFDSETRKCRKATLEDVKKLVILADALDTVNLNEAVADPQEIPHGVRDIYTSRVVLENSTKHCKYPVGSPRGAQALIEMASVVMGGEERLKEKPIISGTAALSPPLYYDKRGIGILMEYVKRGLPIYVGSELISGGISPVTLAGTLVQATAEALAGVVITQVINPGNPVIFGAFCNILDMRTGVAVMGSPEVALMGAATAQLGRHFGLPSWTYSQVTDSKCLDMRAAYEKTMTCLLPLLAGVDIYGATGNLGTAIETSYELMVIEDELTDMLLRILEGIDITRDKLAVEEISKIGPGGNFLSGDHTLKYFKEEHWVPRLAKRESLNSWIGKGAQDIVSAAQKKVEEILTNYEPEPLDSNVEKELNQIVQKYTHEE